MRRPTLSREQHEASVLAHVAAQSGVSSNKIVHEIRARRQVTLRLLSFLEAEGMIESRPGPRGAAVWFLKRKRTA